MKKPFTRALTIALILACILGFIGYQKANEIHNEDPTTPTGHPSGELQQPQIMYDGLIYYYFATGFDELLPAGYECVGEVAEVDNVNIPQNDFHGARVDLMQEIYVLPGIHDTIYVKYDSGYARFSLKQQTAPESIITPTCRSIEEKIADGLFPGDVRNSCLKNERM